MTDRDLEGLFSRFEFSCILLVYAGAPLWLLLYPIPFGLAILVNVLLPGLGVIYTIRATRSLILGLSLPFILPSLALFVKSSEMHIEGNTMLTIVGPAVVFSTFVSIAGVAYDRTSDNSAWHYCPIRTCALGAGMAILFLSVYIVSGSVLANGVLPQEQPRIFTAVIEAKYLYIGRWGPSHTLVITPWGPIQKTNDVAVSKSLYESVKIGQAICMLLHPGALGFKWYAISRCHDTSQ